MMRITSKIDGYRRCGAIHPARPTNYPDDAFTPEQVTILKSDSILTVDLEEKAEITAHLDPADLASMDLADLTKLAKEMELTIPDKATKAQLIELISSEPVKVPAEDIQDGEK